MAFTNQQLYDYMSSASAAGGSNQDIMAAAAKQGVNPDQFIQAYQSSRPDLFVQPSDAAAAYAGGMGSGYATMQADPRMAPTSTMSDYVRANWPGAQQPAAPAAPAPAAEPASGGYTMSADGGAAPTLNTSYQRNPYLDGMADDIGRRTQQGLGEAFNGIRSNSVGVGGLGGSRQGVAEGIGTGRAMDSMQGQLAGLFGTDYTNSMNRNLQQYGIESSNWLGARGQNQNYALGMGGLANQKYGMDQNYSLGMGGLANQSRGQDMNFYTQQRGQDQSGMALGAQLYNQGTQGQWSPIQNASDVYRGYTGLNSSQTTGSGGSGGDWQTYVGAGLAGAKFGQSMGWW